MRTQHILAGALLGLVTVSNPVLAQGRPWSMRHLLLPADGTPRIGASIRDLSPKDLERDKSLSGVVIQEVQRGSPAERAGLRPGDIIVELDGERVRSAQQFVRLVEESVPGREIRSVVVRDGRRQDLRITPQAGRAAEPEPEPPTDPRGWGWGWSPAPPGWGGPPTSRGRLGASVQALTPQLGAHFGAREGLLVSAVQDGSPAARAGLRAGDVITAVGGRAVRSHGELVRELSGEPQGGEVTLSVVRDRKPLTLKVRFDEKKADQRDAVEL